MFLGHLSNYELGDFHFWRCLALVLERKSDKLESKGRKMFIYVGYPKGIAVDYFSSHKDDKVFVKYKNKVSRL